MNTIRSALSAIAKIGGQPAGHSFTSLGWSRESTFAKFYRRPISKKGLFAQAVLAEDNHIGAPHPNSAAPRSPQSYSPSRD
ncbi:hypothetical protein E2C01_028131 [Portunus trituberculatus]|uniref:Uncharacterized protein n=1 Tax=Portunus trituberculatus TaxID=210409 RepID=A0A5B7EJP5_PORTR|nr:hypothetical protein [Portunus trituberculatus]